MPNRIEIRALVNRLSRISGQFTGLKSLIEYGEDSSKVIIQFNAAISSSKAALSYYLNVALHPTPEIHTHNLEKLKSYRVEVSV